MRDFHSTLDLCGVKDLSFSREQFTRANKQEGRDFVQEQLDQYVGNFGWIGLFSNAQVTNLSFYHSDHHAIKISLGSLWVWVRKSTIKGRKRRFHFEEIWAKDEECKEVIATAWGLVDNFLEPHIVLEKLRICAERTDEWGFKSLEE
ncbi:hypothetical protein UlMin_034470 [Ulmus minor]